MSLENANVTVICSVVFFDLIGFSKLSVAGQIAAKERFNQHLAEAIDDYPVDQRIVLDSGDGASVAFLSDPEPALVVALRLRAFGRELGADAMRIGINLGPARIVQDLNGHRNLVGDGINTAERVMSFAPPGGIFVSRSYYEAVSRLTDSYGTAFSPIGERADKHGRAHEVFEVTEVQSSPAESRMPPASAQHAERLHAASSEHQAAAQPDAQHPIAESWRKRLRSSSAKAVALTAVFLGLLALYFSTQQDTHLDVPRQQGIVSPQPASQIGTGGASDSPGVRAAKAAPDPPAVEETALDRNAPLADTPSNRDTGSNRGNSPRAKTQPRTASSAANPRCGNIIHRAALGESLSAEDQDFLRAQCK